MPRLTMTKTLRHSVDFIYLAIEGKSLALRTSGGPSCGAEWDWSFPMSFGLVSLDSVYVCSIAIEMHRTGVSGGRLNAGNT